MKPGNISLLLLGALLVAAAALCLSGAGAARGVAAAPSAGPTAYLPGASPAAAPGITVATRNVSTPLPAATAALVSGKIVNYGTSSDTFKRGERATGFITVQNTGSVVINDVTIHVTASVKLPVVGSTGLGSKDYTFGNLNIGPGETKRIDFTVDIPSEYKGISTAGDYDLQVRVTSGSADIGSFSKAVKVA